MSALNEWISDGIPEVIVEDAAGWLTLLDSERCTPADRLAFARWLDEDRLHRWAFEELSEVWARLHTLVDSAPAYDAPNVSRLPADNDRRLFEPEAPPRSDWSALAIAVIVAIGVVLNIFATTPPERLETQAGELATVRLADQTVVEMNARTSMRAFPEADQPYVELQQGAAVFHRDGALEPLVVATPFGTVSSVGGSFLVSLRATGLDVLAIEEEVSVAAAASEPAVDADIVAADADDYLPRFARLHPGEYLRLGTHLFSLERPGSDELEQILGWRDGSLSFHEQPLVAVVEEMRRYADVNVHIADRSIEETRVTATIPAGNDAAYLEVLAAQDSLLVDRAGANWVVLRHAAPNSH